MCHARFVIMFVLGRNSLCRNDATVFLHMHAHHTIANKKYTWHITQRFMLTISWLREKVHSHIQKDALGKIRHLANSLSSGFFPDTPSECYINNSIEPPDKLSNIVNIFCALFANTAFPQKCYLVFPSTHDLKYPQSDGNHFSWRTISGQTQIKQLL